MTRYVPSMYYNIASRGKCVLFPSKITCTSGSNDRIRSVIILCVVLVENQRAHRHVVSRKVRIIRAYIYGIIIIWSSRFAHIMSLITPVVIRKRKKANIYVIVCSSGLPTERP
jgi:hypothetical protein